MLEVSRTLYATLDLEALLKFVVEVASQLTDSEAASILLLDKKTGGLYFEAAAGEQWGAVERAPVPIEGSMAGWIVQNGEPLVVDSLTDAGMMTRRDKEMMVRGYHHNEKAPVFIGSLFCSSEASLSWPSVTFGRQTVEKSK